MGSVIEVPRLNLQAPEAIEQGAAWQAEFAGRQRLVAGVLAQAIDQQATLDLPQSFAQTHGGTGGRRVEVQREVLDLQLAALAQQYGPFHEGFEFAHIPGEAIGGQMV